MNKILILTGPAACGKNTIAPFIAKEREKCSIINVDMIRQILVNPHKGPWEGEEGKKQQLLGVENACLLAKNFVNYGVDVIILDVLQDDTAHLYKKLLQDYLVTIVLLLPSYEETKIRFEQRYHTITVVEFNLVYKWQEELTIYDKKIDNSNMPAKECAEKLNFLLKILFPNSKVSNG